MTRHQLERAVAGATGESLRTVRNLGFTVLEIEPAARESEAALILDCPFCGRIIPYPGFASDGSPAMAECDACDVYFDAIPDEVYLATGAPA